MRGKVRLAFSAAPSCRITPADAGKSGWFQRRLQHGGGSPPRMRGKDLVKFCLCPRFGITPAYAGKRASHAPRACIYRDHPRVCGEKSMVAPSCGPGTGSPPRMRGKEHRQRQTVWKDGITPAYAGKRYGENEALESGRDHPRVCGEKAKRYKRLFCVMGSPPRMRGKGLQGHQARCRHGITPAYAGKRAAADSGSRQG